MKLGRTIREVGRKQGQELHRRSPVKAGAPPSHSTGILAPGERGRSSQTKEVLGIRSEQGGPLSHRASLLASISRQCWQLDPQIQLFGKNNLNTRKMCKRKN